MKTTTIRVRHGLMLMMLCTALQAPLAGASALDEWADALPGHAFAGADALPRSAKKSTREIGLVQDPFWAHYPGNKKLYALQQPSAPEPEVEG